MAARVNFKFVIILSAALLAVCVLAVGAWYFVASRSGEDYARLGDEAMAAGDYSLASENYGRAVGHDRTNVEWLEKWLASLEELSFDERGAYSRAFQERYVPVLRQLARLKRTDLDLHTRYFEVLIAQLGANARPLAEYINGEIEVVMPLVGGPGGEQDRLLRYRGLAFVQVLAQTGDLPEDELERTEADLRSALAADPGDGEAATALVRILQTEIDDALRNDRTGAVDRLRGEIAGVVGGVTGAAPNDPWAMVLALATDLDRRRERISAETIDPRAREQRFAAMRSELREPLDELHAVLLEVPAAEAEAGVLDRFQFMEQVIDPEAEFGRTLSLLRRYDEQSPEDAALLVRHALALSEAGDLEDAIGLLDRARGLESRPLSAAGFAQFGFQAVAARLSSDFHLRLAQPLAEDDPRREELLDAARSARDEYARLVQTGTIDLRLLDGMIAIAENRLPDAIAELSAYNAAANFNDRRGLLLEARVAQALDRRGTARERLDQLTNLEPTNPEPYVLLAQIERSFNQPANLQRAIELCETALQVAPGYERAEDLLTQLRIETGDESSGDPALDAIFEARRTLRGDDQTPGDPDAAERILRASLAANNFDPRVVRELASRLLDTDRLPEAREIVAEGRARHPDDEALVRVAGLLESDTVADAISALIEESDADPLEKALSRYRVFAGAGRGEDAEAALDAAIAIDPESPAVLELRMRRALLGRDMDEARAIRDTAEAVDADGMGGVTFSARVAAAEGQPQEAVRLFEEAIETGRADASVHRALAATLRGMGRTAAALESYRAALQIRPDDIPTINQYVSLLAQSGQATEALEEARRFRGLAESDEGFLNLYLTLEASSGGPEGRRRAIAQRRRLLSQQPSNRSNRAALASLFIEDRQWLEARALIDEMRERRLDLDAVALDARWYADQGRVRVDGEFRSGIELAQRTFVEYIVGLDDDELGVEAYLTLARFMIQRGQYGVAVRAIDDARPLQNPRRLRAEKLFGDLMLTLGRPVEAAEAFRQIVDAGADDESQSYRKRLIEMLLRQNEFAAAEAQIDALGPEFDEDLTIMMQRADVLIGEGRRTEALALLNRAVSTHPDSAVVYTKRAQVLVADEASLNDALADLETALDIQPGEWRTLRLRASVYYQLDRVDDALDDLRQTVRANPTLDEVLLGLMIELIGLNRDGEALDIAIEVIDQRPTDTTLMITAGRVLSDRGFWGRSAVLYGRAWELSQDPLLAIRYIDALVNADPPRPDEAERVLRRVVELGGDPSEDSELLIAQALIEHARDRSVRARSFLTQAFNATDATPPARLNWIRNVIRLYGEGNADAAAGFIRDLQRETEDPADRDWLEFAAGRALLGDDRTFEDGASVLRALAGSSAADGVRRFAYRTLGGSLYEREAFAEAESAWRNGLEDFPDDWEMTNNLAYTVGVELERTRDGMELARRAVELAPNQSQAWDTLAKLHLVLGQLDDAEAALDEGERNIRSAAARINITLNRARIAVARGNCDVARSFLSQARTSSDTLPQLRGRFEPDIEELVAQIESDC